MSAAKHRHTSTQTLATKHLSAVSLLFSLKHTSLTGSESVSFWEMKRIWSDKRSHTQSEFIWQCVCGWWSCGISRSKLLIAFHKPTLVYPKPLPAQGQSLGKNLRSKVFELAIFGLLGQLLKGLSWKQYMWLNWPAQSIWPSGVRPRSPCHRPAAVWPAPALSSAAYETHWPLSSSSHFRHASAQSPCAGSSSPLSPHGASPSSQHGGTPAPVKDRGINLWLFTQLRRVTAGKNSVFLKIFFFSTTLSPKSPL